MLQYRVTKYNPVHRDASGAFKRNEWTAISQIGDTFDDGVLTPLDYLTAEDAYIHAAVSFLAESRIESLAIGSLENAHEYQSSSMTLSNGHECSLLEIVGIARLVLRDHIWCKLSCDAAFLHIGRDFYIVRWCPCRLPKCNSNRDPVGAVRRDFQFSIP